MNAFEARRLVETVLGPVRWFADNAGFCACPNWQKHERIAHARELHRDSLFCRAPEGTPEPNSIDFKMPPPHPHETTVQFDPVEIRCINEMTYGGDDVLPPFRSTCREPIERAEAKIQKLLEGKK